MKGYGVAPDPSEPHNHAHPPAAGPVADASIRLARPNDASAVGSVQAAIWRSAYGKILPRDVVEELDPAIFARVWRDSLKQPPSPRHVLLVACAGEQVVGFAALGPSADPDADETSGEVLELGIHPEARRSGHGSRLLNAAVDTLRDMGFRSMALWLLARDEDTRAFLTAAGLSPDSAYRDRVIDSAGSGAESSGDEGTDADGDGAGQTVREVRLSADLSRD
jgi:ribosomal protein S18 acetylase RimI-like enzyme